MSGQAERYERARKTAGQKVDVLRHALVYVVVIALLAVINNITAPGYQWWLWPAIG